MPKNFLTAKWEDLVMANYAVAPEILTSYLPAGVELDLYNGKAYLSLVGFMFRNTRIFGVPIPVLGTFEEVNLRFYVLRKEGNTIKRGVVFINETIPYKIVAFMANILYKEHYIAIPTRHHSSTNQGIKHLEYQWKVNDEWNSVSADASTRQQVIKKGSFEEYIFEHYYGYTKVNEGTTEEYRIDHPKWNTHEVLFSNVVCNFGAVYGKEFGFLSSENPASVILAAGSEVAVKWKRNRLAI